MASKHVRVCDPRCLRLPCPLCLLGLPGYASS
jgi:hypothetical protein